jgi:hypothetical protein
MNLDVILIIESGIKKKIYFVANIFTANKTKFL